MLFPLSVAIVYRESSLSAFLTAIVVCAVLGLSLCRMGQLETEHLSVREGIAITGMGWIMVTFLGMIPYAAGDYLPVLDGVMNSRRSPWSSDR